MLFHAYPRGGEIHYTRHFDFREGSVLVPGATFGTVWVYRPIQVDGNGEWGIGQVTETGLYVPMYRGLKKGMQQLVANGCNGFWGLTSVNETESNLIFVDANNVNGKLICKRIPSVTQLFMDCTGGVWMYIAAHDASRAILSPGLYHVNALGRWLRIVSDLDKKCLLCSDSGRKGILFLLPGKKAGESVLSHIGAFRLRRNQKLDVDFSKVQAIYDDGRDGALIHYKSHSGWKLANASFGDRNVYDKYPCPRNAQVTTTGKLGSVWVLKKKGAYRGIQYLCGENSIADSPQKYNVGTFLGGCPADRLIAPDDLYRV
jgi:hypothetical protein